MEALVELTQRVFQGVWLQSGEHLLSLKAFSCLEGPAVSIFSSGGVHLQTWARELQLVFPANRKVLQSILALRLRKSPWNLGEVSNYSSFRCCQFQASDIPAAAKKQNTN